MERAIISLSREYSHAKKIQHQMQNGIELQMNADLGQSLSNAAKNS